MDTILLEKLLALLVEKDSLKAVHAYLQAQQVKTTSDTVEQTLLEKINALLPNSAQTLVFLRNIYNPELPDVLDKIPPHASMSKVDVYHQQQEWLKDKILGEPQATKIWTVDELKELGFVGIYGQAE
ncbi:hypothetical protein [Beggiatoa leptomitoformis]|uniref:Uncharacterized protein n=1 Tax=Beggiatoa leptomitoformis TaxID=288004 RepID=A0A2N9YGM9_9GAMM|nr:hypothetical protein [Beggiatoa leptomitoformis]ALG68062.1 hypothetical protein AL038_10530 [Beggiatoa leptomitoformis]AUI69647.1 hypothetical protein BLE401_13745 [Beggiatoa leptomitoformis]